MGEHKDEKFLASVYLDSFTTELGQSLVAHLRVQKVIIISYLLYYIAESIPYHVDY